MLGSPYNLPLRNRRGVEV